MIRSNILSVALLTTLVSMAEAQNYCLPQTQNYCCGYGIVSVTLPGLYQESADASAGYENYSSLTAHATEGEPLTVSVQTGGTEPHDVRIWLDADNDGNFSHPGELVYEQLAVTDPSGVLTLPPDLLFGIPLRIRVMADFAGSNPQPCTEPTFGQAEDYSFVLTAAAQAPVAGFSASPTATCNGTVFFTQQATGNPTAYRWDFGDGQTSVATDPVHTYQADGTYTVKLTVSNSQASDSLEKQHYIQVALSETCDTFPVPAQGTATVLYNYDFVLTDNGKTGPYSDNTNGSISIQPLWAQQVCLHFREFYFETPFDYLEIYDGASQAAPLLGHYTGSALPPDVCSSGPALCIKQYSDDIVTYPGFVAQVNSTMSISPVSVNEVAVYPNPFRDGFRVQPSPAVTGDLILQLLNLSGQVVLEQSIQNYSGTPIDITSPQMAAGLYLLRLRTPDGTRQQKLLKIN